MRTSPAREADARSSAALSVLHLDRVESQEEVRSALEAARDRSVVFVRGMNRSIEREIARIVDLNGSDAVFETENFQPDNRELLFLNFQLGSSVYFMEATIISRIPAGQLRVRIPKALYKTERRSRNRATSYPESHVSLRQPSGIVGDAALVDTSPDGVGVLIPSPLATTLTAGTPLVIEDRGHEVHGALRNIGPSDSCGWTRLGIELAPAPLGEVREVSHLTMRSASRLGRASQAVRIAIGGAQMAFERALRSVAHVEPEPVRVVEFPDPSGRPIRGILDSFGAMSGGTAVVIPPAWGRTKETLMPLALTLVECFKRAALPVTVLRFDGINRRGESFREDGKGPDARDQSCFTFSQGVVDIHSAVRFLHSDPSNSPFRTILVSFSAASIEARRAVSENSRIDGWVCVVGSADTQSMMRSISGGIDYARGLESGATFGMQEILGVAVDMDLAGRDALEKRLVYLSDSKADMARIAVPVTWIHGEHDAWMDRDRTRRILACGDTSRRKLVNVPTGHMLKSSQEALGVFQLIAREVSEMAVGRHVPVAIPRLTRIERRQHAERSRLPNESSSDIRRFWEDYLLGKDRSIGIELMTMTPAYAELMHTQIEALKLGVNDRVVDLGSGTGAFPYYLHENSKAPKQVLVVECDFVKGALTRAQERIGHHASMSFVETDLGLGQRASNFPFQSGSVQGLIASLFLSYVQDPATLLPEMYRIVAPGGRVVVSSLRRDADMSKLFVDAIPHLREKWSRDLATWAGGVPFETAIRAYLNEASRLLDFEESGQFTFWDGTQLERMLRRAGFIEIEVNEAFGSPPQAIVVSGQKPD